jgi:hypothetical protein
VIPISMKDAHEYGNENENMPGEEKYNTGGILS